MYDVSYIIQIIFYQNWTVNGSNLGSLNDNVILPMKKNFKDIIILYLHVPEVLHTSTMSFQYYLLKIYS